MNRSKILTTIASLLLACALYAQAQTKVVKHALKHRTGGEAQARLRHSASTVSKLIATCLTLLLLGSGGALAARYGDFSMRAGDPRMETGSSHRRQASREVECRGGKRVALPAGDSDRAGCNRLVKNIVRSPRQTV